MAGTVTSDTAICNSALVKLGVEPIASLTENSKPAKLCKSQYPLMRDKLLRSHYWNFAIKRVEIAGVAADPLFEFDYQYQLPADCLRVIYDQEKDVVFKVEGDKLLSNLSTITIKYVSRITTVGLYDANFVDALAYMLALDLTYALNQSKGLRDRLEIALKNELKDAKSIDGQGDHQDRLMNDVFLEARVGDHLRGLGRNVKV